MLSTRLPAARGAGKRSSRVGGIVEPASDVAAHEIAEPVNRGVGDPVVDGRPPMLALEKALLDEQREVARYVRRRIAARLGERADVALPVAARTLRRASRSMTRLV